MIIGDINKYCFILPLKMFSFYIKFTNKYEIFKYMYYNINMNLLRNKFIFIFFSISISLCFMLNIFAMYVKNADISLKANVPNTVVSKFFKVLNFSNDIVSSMGKQKTTTQNKKNTQTKKDNVWDISFTSISINYANYENIKNELKQQISILTNLFSAQYLIDYPLKIPFWRIIVFILLFRMLFNVLPRSISIRKNINYRQACTLL